MYRLKTIADILKCPGMIPLPSVVQPDRQQCQQCKTMLRKLHCAVENRDRQQFAGQALTVDPIQPCKLCKPLPPHVSRKKDKQEHRQYAKAVVICHAKSAKRITKAATRPLSAACKSRPPLPAFSKTPASLQVCQSCRFLETGPLFPPLTALCRFSLRAKCFFASAAAENRFYFHYAVRGAMENAL